MEERDFTLDNLNNLDQFFNTINPDSNTDIADNAQEFKSTYSDVLSKIGGEHIINTIILDNTDLASIKTTCQSELETIFNNMYAVDKPYGKDTYDSLSDLKNAIEALSIVSCNSSSALDKENPLNALLEIFNNETIREATAKECTSLYKRLCDQVVKTIHKLENAANKGYEACKDSNDPTIKKALEAMTEAKEAITAKTDLDAVFAAACIITIVRESEQYGKSVATEFTAEETLLVGSRLIALNEESKKVVSADEYNKAADEAVKGVDNYHGKISELKCAGYDAQLYRGLGPYNKLTQFDTEGQTYKDENEKLYFGKGFQKSVVYTTPQLGAYIGKPSRQIVNTEDKDLIEHFTTNTMEEHIKLHISTGAKEELITMHLPIPGQESEEVKLNIQKSTSFTADEKKDIICASKSQQALDKVYINGQPKKKGESYPVDQDQVHVIELNAHDKYSQKNPSQFMKPFDKDYNYKSKSLKKGSTGYDFLLMNHTDEGLKTLNNNYPSAFPDQ